jgi:subtilisin family serine protease
LNDAKNYLSQAKAALARGDYLQAQSLAQQAQRAAGDAQKKAKEALDNVPRPRAPGEIIVEVVAGRIEAVASRYNLKVLDQLNNTNIYRVQIPDGKTIDQVLEALKKDPDVVRAEPNHLVQSPVIDQKAIIFLDQKAIIFLDGSSPSNYFDQSALTRIQLEEAQQVIKGGGITVAVIDTGIDLQHPAFTNRLSQFMFDFVEGDSDPSEMGVGTDPGYGHGTFVAGIVSLIAPEAKIMPLRTFNPQGEATIFNIAKAIYYAVKNGAQVINMSFGLDTPLDVPPVGIDKAVEYAKTQGVVTIASAGNEGFEDYQFPAKFESVIAVAATDSNDVRAEFSNYGDHIDVSAPGVGVYSTYPGGKFGWWDGTSFSTAFVSGEAALVFARTLTMPPQQDPRCSQQGPRCVVINAIQDSAVNIDDKNDGYEGKLGKGRIDVLGAVRKVTPGVQ